jgi:hypothetical protein
VGERLSLPTAHFGVQDPTEWELYAAGQGVGTARRRALQVKQGEPVRRFLPWRGKPRRIHKSGQYTIKEVNCSCGHFVWLETGKSMAMHTVY